MNSSILKIFLHSKELILMRKHFHKLPEKHTHHKCLHPLTHTSIHDFLWTEHARVNLMVILTPYILCPAKFGLQEGCHFFVFLSFPVEQNISL